MVFVSDAVVAAGPHILGDIADGFGSIDVTVNGTSVYTYSWTGHI